ncbi:hypothetical protein KDA23_03130 [Candidatus Saccharibacteria bacterium]|nr:hypothetical protein [Candidatus Saccharibacteria bacterium]
MTLNLLLTALAIAILLGIVSVIGRVLSRRMPRKFDTERFHKRWQEIQGQCKSKETWPLAVIDADKLLDEALKKSHYKGRSMGERLVSAQRDLSDNDGVWYGHKLRNKLVHEEMKNLKQRDVQDALKGFRQALRDLGAMTK